MSRLYKLGKSFRKILSTVNQFKRTKNLKFINNLFVTHTNKNKKILLISIVFLSLMFVWGVNNYNHNKKLKLVKSLGFESIQQMESLTKMGYKDMQSWQERYKKFGFTSLDQMNLFNQLGYTYYEDIKNDLEISSQFFINSCNAKITSESCKDKNYLWLGKIYFVNGKPSSVIILNNDGTQNGLKSEKKVILKGYTPLRHKTNKTYVVFNGKNGEDNFWGYDKLFVKKAIFFDTLEKANDVFSGLVAEDKLIIPKDLTKMGKNELESLEASELIKLINQTKESLFTVKDFSNNIFKAIECVGGSNKKEFFFFSGKLSDVLTTTAYSMGLYENSQGSINFTKQKFNGAFIFSNGRLSRGGYEDKLDRYEIKFAHPIDSNITYPNKSYFYIKKDGTGFAQDLNGALRQTGLLSYFGACTSINNAGERFHQYWQNEKNNTANKAIKKIKKYSVKPIL